MSPKTFLGLLIIIFAAKAQENNVNHPVSKVQESPGISIVQGKNYANQDLQSYGGDERHLWVLPDGSVHAVFYGCLGTPNGSGRSSYYAFSEDGGATFKKPIRVESQTAAFPSMDIAPDGCAVIAAHNGYSPYGVIVSVDSAKGRGKFTTFNAPGNTQNSGLARVAVTSDSLAVVLGYDESYGRIFWNILNYQTGRFIKKMSEYIFPKIPNETTYTLATNRKGRVAMVVVNVCFPNNKIPEENNIWAMESSDGGLTWGDPFKVTPYTYQSTDIQSFVWSEMTALYINDELHVVWLELCANKKNRILIPEGVKLMHWCANVNDGQPVAAVQWDAQHFCSLENWQGFFSPSIGVDENGIITIVFSSYVGDERCLDPATGWQYSDIFAVSSADGGLTWGEPQNLTNSPMIDDGYPYLSPWNEAGKINILYTTDTKTGMLYPNGDPKYLGKVDHLFLKVDHPSTTPYSTHVYDEEELKPFNFSLDQNYPNPFNPSTVIEYECGTTAHVKLEVYDLLGRRIETLVDGERHAGRHSEIWRAIDGQGHPLPAGMYFAHLTANGIQQSIKMTLIR